MSSRCNERNNKWRS